jgi:hypothetical protein
MNAVMKALGNTPGRSAHSHRDALIAKDDYRKLCETERSIPIFSTDWWLDAAVGPQSWDVVLVKENGRIIGAMPFARAWKFGMKVIHQPPLTPFLGPWILPNSEKTSTRLGREQRIMQSLIEQLPKFDNFRLTWNKGLSNWLPFYWSGFSQTTDYTYVIHGLDDLDRVWNQLESSRRKHCKRGAAESTLREDLPVEAFLHLHKICLASRGVSQSFTDDCLQRIDDACVARKCRKIHIIVDEAGRPIAGTYTVWDENSAYALMKGRDPNTENVNAPSVCQWEAIKFSSTVSDKYDFLGNMNPSIEPYVRSFGAEQTPIFTISKTPSKLLRLRRGVKSALATGH